MGINSHSLKRKLWWIVLLLIIALYFIKLPFFYTEPGDALELSSFVEIEEGYEDAEGSFMLTTISMARANSYLYVWSKLLPYRELLPIENVKPIDETDEQYFNRQRLVMERSQENALMVAYQKAGKKVDIQYNGIVISSIIDGMPASEKLKSGDRIKEVDGQPIINVQQLNQLTASKQKGESVRLTVERKGEIFEIDIPLMPFPEHLAGSDERVGLGILYPMVDRTVTFEPKATIDAEKIGGPSAGLMFSLEIYNRLVEEDITKGYQIAGTGEIDEEGNVGRIGGVHQKVIAAHKKGADIFFAPKEGNREDSNYNIAKQIATKEGMEMEIVGVDTFDDAISYLAQLEPKS